MIEIVSLASRFCTQDFASVKKIRQKKLDSRQPQNSQPPASQMITELKVTL